MMLGMDLLSWDMSYQRAGRTLEQWLPELVSDDPGRRKAAADALGGMWRALPSYGTDYNKMDLAHLPDLAARAEDFNRKIRQAVERPEFSKAVFVRRLMLFRLSLREDWLQRVAKMSHHDEKYDRRETELIEKSLLSTDTAEQERAAKRFTKLFCASLHRDNKLSSSSENMQPPGMLSFLVFGAMDTALLEAADVLVEMLSTKGTRHEAIEAISRIGSTGVVLVTQLLDDLETFDPTAHYDAGSALGSIARNHEPTIIRLLQLVAGTDAPRIRRALSVLAAMGRDLSTHVQECLDLLLPLAQRSDLRWAVLPALASVGRDEERALNIIVEESATRPPHMVKFEGSEYEYDEVMYRRGAAISLLRYFSRFRDRVIPILIDAFITFEEFDPDERRCGEHYRILRTFRQIGATSAAAPALLQHIRDSDGSVNYEVVRLLGDIGAPIAAIALPALERLREELAAEFPEAKVPSIEQISRKRYPVEWSIRRMGEAERRVTY